MNYTVKIFTEIKADDYEDAFQVSYPCGYSFENGVHRLKYTDEEAGFTVVKIVPDGRIEIRRKNSFTIILQNGLTHRHSHYISRIIIIPCSIDVIPFASNSNSCPFMS